MTSCVIIGGGIVGLATGLKLLERHPAARVTILEKEAGVAQHQSTHNSGVLHCGLYYKPGSLKARLAVEGIREMVAFCRAHDIPHEICGKLVVATREAEMPRLDELLRRGAANGLTGLRRSSGTKCAASNRTPRASPPRRCRRKASWITAPSAMRWRRRFRNAAASSSRARRVTALHRHGDEWIAETREGETRGQMAHQHRRPALRPRQPTRRREARGAHRALPR